MTLMERTPRSFAPPAPRRTTLCLPEESLKARMISVLSRVCSIKQVCRRTRPLLRETLLNCLFRLLLVKTGLALGGGEARRFGKYFLQKLSKTSLTEY
jgi:hypothetical protein